MPGVGRQETEMDPISRQALRRAIEVLREFQEVIGIGLAGSHVLGVADKYSDVDLQAFVTEIPQLNRRRDVYEQAGIQVGPLDHSVAGEFESLPSKLPFVVDWLTVGGVKCDFLWMPREDVDRLLSSLPSQPMQREAIAVLANVIAPAFDPHGYVDRMKQDCPEYSKERSARKARNKFGYAHFFLCSWGVLHKCLFRRDFIAYQQAESEMIGVLVDALYAINRTWQHDRRRLRAYAGGFEIMPAGFLDRIESVIRRESGDRDLRVCHQELLSLFRDLAAAANDAFRTWDLPTEWQVNEN